MIKPKDFDTAQGFTGFTPLEPGGHICKIMNVEETTSKKGNRPMIVISIDTDKTDKQPEFFTQQYKNNQKPDKKWSNNAVVRQLVYDADDNTNAGFKTFVDAIKASNPGFNENVLWGNEPINKFLKGKLIGGVFGREEYLNGYGESKFAVKFQSFRTVEDIKKGVKVPKDKLLNPGSNNSNVPDIYGDITPVDNGDMPF